MFGTRSSKQLGCLGLLLGYLTMMPVLAQVTVTPTLLRCTNGNPSGSTSASIGGCSQVVVERSISLLNGAIDYEGVMYINTTHVVTMIASGISPLSIAVGVNPSTYTTTIFVEIINTSLRNTTASTTATTAITTVTNVQGVTDGVIIPTATLVMSTIPPFLDDLNNPWTLPPLTTSSSPAKPITITFRKANTKVRFTMQHAVVKSYYPVSEYMFEVPSDAALCTSGTSTAAAAGYKCCLIPAPSSSTGVAYYEVYCLSSAVEPTTCTVNASIVYLDHYSTMDVGYAWWAVTSASTKYSDSIGLTVAGDVQVAVSGLSNSSDAGMLQVSRSAGQISFFTSIVQQQLCRKGGYLTNTAQPEPFFVNNWVFGYSSRQIGYNVTQYVTDRQCNGAPLGYYTSNDGNNSDQFSASRARTTTSVLVPLSWRNDLVTVSGITNGVTFYYGDYFSMSTLTSPATSATIQFSPAAAKSPTMRPSFYTVIAIVGFFSVPSRVNASAVSISHGLQLSASPVYATTSTTQPSPASVMITSACTSIIGASSVTITSLGTSALRFPLTVGWVQAVPLALFQSPPTSTTTVSCTYNVSRTDINTSVVTASATPALPSTLVAAMSDDDPTTVVLMLLTAAPAAFASNLTHMSLYAVHRVTTPPLSPLRVSSTSAQTCPPDAFYNLWVGTCDPMQDLTCGSRYPPTNTTATSSTTKTRSGRGRPVMDTTMVKCIPNATTTTTTSVWTIDAIQSAQQSIFSRLYESAVWSGTSSRGPSGVIDAYASSTELASTLAPTASPSGGGTPVTTFVITVPSWMSAGSAYVSLTTGAVTSFKPSAVPNTSLVLMIFTNTNTSSPPSSGDWGDAGWIASLRLAVSQLPFTGKATAGLVLLLVASLFVLLVLYVWVRLRHWLPWGDDAAIAWAVFQDKRPTWEGVKAKAAVVAEALSSLWVRWTTYRLDRAKEQKRLAKEQRRQRRQRRESGGANGSDGAEFAVPIHGDDHHEAAGRNAHAAPTVGGRVLSWLQGLTRRTTQKHVRKPQRPSTESSASSRVSGGQRRSQRQSVTSRRTTVDESGEAERRRRHTARQPSSDLVSSDDGRDTNDEGAHHPLHTSNLDAANANEERHVSDEENATRMLTYTNTLGDHSLVLPQSTVQALSSRRLQERPHHPYGRIHQANRLLTLSPPDGIDEGPRNHHNNSQQAAFSRQHETTQGGILQDLRTQQRHHPDVVHNNANSQRGGPCIELPPRSPSSASHNPQSSPSPIRSHRRPAAAPIGVPREELEEKPQSFSTPPRRPSHIEPTYNEELDPHVASSADQRSRITRRDVSSSSLQLQYTSHNPSVSTHHAAPTILEASSPSPRKHHSAAQHHDQQPHRRHHHHHSRPHYAEPPPRPRLTPSPSVEGSSVTGHAPRTAATSLAPAPVAPSEIDHRHEHPLSLGHHKIVVQISSLQTQPPPDHAQPRSQQYHDAETMSLAVQQRFLAAICDQAASETVASDEAASVASMMTKATEARQRHVGRRRSHAEGHSLHGPTSSTLITPREHRRRRSHNDAPQLSVASAAPLPHPGSSTSVRNRRADSPAADDGNVDGGGSNVLPYRCG